MRLSSLAAPGSLWTSNRNSWIVKLQAEHEANLIYSYLKNGTFTFFIGPEQERFDLHADLVAKVSMTLPAMMNNKHMEESIKGQANLKEIDATTFILFAEYIYSGKYRTDQVSGLSTAGNLASFIADCDQIRTAIMAADSVPTDAVCHCCITFIIKDRRDSSDGYYPYCCSDCRKESKNMVKLPTV